MKFIASSSVAMLCVMIAGCSTDLETVGAAPKLSAVGAGLGSVAADSGIEGIASLSEESGTWRGSDADFFRDARAVRTGDLITVKIEINDQASLNSTSNRSRSSSSDADLGVNYSTMGIVGVDVNGSANVNSNTSSEGQGSTARSERIQMSVAGMVTRVMPNGYLVIEGSQEVLVNFEQRTLHVAGLIRPADIAPDNSISYEKIAEARISYGGKGRISEVQQPGWGQQVWDRISPF